jgi:hypothetical protein
MCEKCELLRAENTRLQKELSESTSDGYEMAKRYTEISNRCGTMTVVLRMLYSLLEEAKDIISVLPYAVKLARWKNKLAKVAAYLPEDITKK